MLTETAINAATRRAAETGKRLTLTDPGHAGLQLRITPKGVRTWVLYCFVNGRPRRFVLGRYPALGLAQARRAADAMRERVRQGADPIAEARQKRAATEAAREHVAGTLKAMLDLYGEKRGNSQKTWREARKRIDLVFAPLLARPAATLAGSDLQMCADAYPSATSASFVVRSVRPALKWAAAPGRAYVAKELTEITSPATVRRRQRTLSRAELAALLPVLRDDVTAYGPAMTFMLLTLARREEVCGACWREFDLERSLWTLSSERTKPGRPHVVPLSRQALDLLHDRLPKDTPADPAELVFGTRSGGTLGNWHRETARIMAASGTTGWTRHDLRRTGATVLGELGVEPHIIESALNHAHVAGSSLASLYNAARYRPQVATALQLLADALDGIERGSAEVVRLVPPA